MLRQFTKMNQPGILSCPMHYSLTVMAIQAFSFAHIYRYRLHSHLLGDLPFFFFLALFFRMCMK